jgi:hypothetical protein
MRKILLLLFVLVVTGIVANARTINALPESGFAWTFGFRQLYQIDSPNEILFSYETSGAFKKGSYILYLNDNREPTRFKVIADKTIVLSSELTSDTSLFNSNWNIAKVVHRGSGVEETCFGVKLQAETLLILLK